MTEQKKLTFAESIDKAIEILQELRNQENNNGAFVLTATQDDPTNSSAVILSCVCTGPLENQLNGLLQYVNKDPRIMPVLKHCSESH